MRRALSVLPVLVGPLFMMSVVLLNGRPSVFTDTDDYFVEGHTFAYTIAYALHWKTPDPPPTTPEDIADAKQAAADLHMSHTEVGARSPRAASRDATGEAPARGPGCTVPGTCTAGGNDGTGGGSDVPTEIEGTDGPSGAAGGFASKTMSSLAVVGGLTENTIG